MENNNLITLTAEIVAAHVSNNSVAISDIGNLVQRIHEALTRLGEAPVEDAPQAPVPVVSIRKSVKPDHIVCLLDGSKHKMLKRHLQTAHGLTPQQYREEFGLKPDYPMVAPEYSDQRRTLAKSFGLGRKKAEPEAASARAKRAPRKARASRETAPNE